MSRQISALTLYLFALLAKVSLDYADTHGDWLSRLEVAYNNGELV